MVAEYHRLVDEAKFANPVFWILNLLVEVICVIVLRSIIWATTIMTFTALFTVVVNLALVVLMCWTTKHNLRYRTPLIIDYPEDTLLPASTRVTLLQGSISFKIQFQEKALTIQDGVYFQFRIDVSGQGQQENVKVVLKWKDFEELEQMVLVVAKKQS